MQVWDNWVGIAATNGNVEQLDRYCIQSFGEEACAHWAQTQQVNNTFVDVLADHGYNVTMYGKVHAGGGLDRFAGHINSFPFHGINMAKAAGEWARATGILPDNTKTPSFDVPDDCPAPATSNDYMTTDACQHALEDGLFKSSTPQFLYCSILVPHPPYKTNSTYLAKIPASLGNLSVPKWVPRDQLHPSDEYTIKMKKMWNIDNASPEVHHVIALLPP